MSAPEETAAPETMAVPESWPAREYFSRAEVVEAIQSLTSVEKTKLLRYAMVKAAQTPYEGVDLLQETLTRCLEGRRAWPTDVCAVDFLCGVTKSIASEWTKPLPVESLEDEEHAIGEEERNAIAIRREERHAVGRIDAGKIVKLFADDVIAQRIIIGIMEGVRGEELQQSSGLNKVEYESKREENTAAA
jgi:hypothetical protein